MVTLVVLLLVAGLIFLAAELFILPGFGIAGILGLLFLIGGSVAAWTWLGSGWGGLAVLITLISAITLVIWAFRSRGIKQRLILSTQLKAGGGTASADLTDFVGKTGKTKSDLRPAGIAVVDERRVDVVSEGGFIAKATKITVVAVDGPRIIVAPFERPEKETI
ncbi:MAG: NfeD family protein [Myxococcota bacterium]|nr:NfeD family protein [Myxococcota bacterium]